MRGRKNEEEEQVGVAGRPVKLSSDIKLTRKMCRQTTIQFWEMDGMVDLYPSFSLSLAPFRSLYTMPASLSTNTGTPAQKEQGNCRPLSICSLPSLCTLACHDRTICPAELLVDEWF